MAINLKEKIQTANAVKNATVYAPHGITYSTFFNPALENILLDLGETKQIPLLQKHHAVPSLSFNLAIKRRPSYRLAFDSYREAGQHLISPAFMPIFAAIEAAKALLNALILMPYYFIMGLSNLFTKNYEDAKEDFTNTFVYLPLGVVFWTFSIFIDPCLELVSWLSRAAATMMYGWSGNKEIEKQKEYDALKTASTDAIKSALEHIPGATEAVAIALSGAQAQVQGLKTFLKTMPDITKQLAEVLRNFNAPLIAIQHQMQADPNGAKQALKALLTNKIVPDITNLLQAVFGENFQKFAEGTLIPPVQGFVRGLPLMDQLPFLGNYIQQAEEHIATLRQQLSTLGNPQELKNLLDALVAGKDAFEATFQENEQLVRLLTVLCTKTPEQAFEMLTQNADLNDILSNLITAPEQLKILSTVVLPLASFKLAQADEILTTRGLELLAKLTEALGKAETGIKELHKTLAPTPVPI